MGHDHLRRGLRVFRLDRVLEAEPLGETYERPPGYETSEELLGTLSAMPQDRRAVEVLLETTPERAREELPLGRPARHRGLPTDALLDLRSSLDGPGAGRALLPVRGAGALPELREALGRRAEEIAVLAGRTGDRA